MPVTQAPTLEKLAIAPTPPAAADGAAPSDDHDQVAAAFRVGWAIEELVGRLTSWPSSTPPTSADDFPPDLTHQRSPEEHIRELASLLKANGKRVVGANDEPALTAITLAKVSALLAASEQRGDTAPFLKGDQRISVAIPQWDAQMVDAIIDQNPAVLTAYEVGKALSLTQWRIRGAPSADQPPAPAGAANSDAAGPAASASSDPFADAWAGAFARDRVTRIRRHLETLAPSIDPRTVAAVSASLSFWSRAYEKGQLLRAGQRNALTNQLNAQLGIWYDLLTGRRQLESFPVTGVVSDLVQQYTSMRVVQWRPVLLLIVGIVVALVLVAAGVAVVLGLFNTPGSVQPAASGVAGGVTALTAFLAARGAGLLDRGSTAVQDLQARVTQLQNQVAGMTRGATNQPPPLTFVGLAGDVLANVVEQIRLEECKIAISQPLVDYIMGRDLKAPPQQVMHDFLTQILGTDQTSNLDRLQNVLEGLYRDYKPELPSTL